MKILALFTIFVLIFGTASTSLVGNAFAQNDPYILLRIATQADKQIVNQLENIYGDSIPFEIQTLYQNGHTTVQLLEDSISGDIEETKENFLLAMQAFKQITKILPTSEINNTATADDRDLESELNRLEMYFYNIKTISEKHDTGIDLSDTEELFAQAHDLINSGESDAAAIQTIEQLELLIEAVKQDIREHASHSTFDRNKNFALKQLDKIKVTLDMAKSIDSDIPELEEANLLVQEIEILISEGNIFDVKEKFTKLIKLVKTIEESSS